jgi:2'-5' RNA ligase
LEVVESLKSKDPKANYTRPENIHLTLAFLGEINEKEKALIKGVVDGLDNPPFGISINKLRNFKDMAILEVKPNQHLTKLYESLVEGLAGCGILLEKRKYYPHITLSRKTVLRVDKDFEMKSNVEEIILFSSERRAILTYLPIHIKRL